MLRALTFGQCAFETPAARIAPDSGVHFALLLSVVAGPPDGVARDDLVARIWPRSEGEVGRHCLRQAMYRLRQLAVPVRLRAGSIVLDWEATQAEVHTLLHGALGRDDLVRLGRVPFLPSYAPALGDPFGDWLESLRARVATRLRRALADEVLSTRGRGRFHEMGQVARALLALDPLNEVGTMGLAEAMVLEGSKVEALRLLEDYEEEVGAVNAHLQLPVRVLRRRVAEVLDDSLALRRFEVPFVGREREFGELRALLREVNQGQSRAAFITGEAGIGKSRLAGELLRLAALDGATLASYTTSAGDTFTPISTLVTVGQQLLTLPGALGCAQEHLSYVRRLGTPETVTAWSMAGMAADILYAQLVQAFGELVSAIAEEAPLVLFVDDAERLHPTTWRVLVDVWERVGARSVLFLLAARRLPAWFGSLGARSCERLAHQVRLFPFGREESLQFLRLWSEKNRVSFADDGAHRCAAASQGNPFYLSELAAHLGRGGDPHQTPATIRELIAAQHVSLSKGAQRVLLVIALFEARATTARVTQLLEVSAAELMAGLEELEEAGLVATRGPVVWCRHRLVGEVSKSLAMPSVLAYAHGRAAWLLEAEADASDSVELLGDCVTHWERAGETRRAYEAAMKLGYRLVGMGMGEEAEKAFVRAEGLAEERTQRQSAIEGRMLSCQLAARWSDIGQLAIARAQTLHTLENTVSHVDEFELLVAEAALFSSLSSPSTHRLTELATHPTLPKRTRLRASVLLAILADNYFQKDLLHHALRVSLELLDESEASPEGALLQTIFHSTIGDRAIANLSLDQMLELSRSSGDFSWRLLGLRRSSEAALRVGRLDTAMECALEALHLSRTLRLPVQEADTLERLVHIAVARQDLDAASTFAHEIGTIEVSKHELLIRHRLASETLLAWIGRDESRASELLEIAESLPIPPVPRAEQTLLTIRQASAILTKCKSLDDSLVTRLHELCELGQSFGGQDFASSVLIESLNLAGDVTAAQSFRQQYTERSRLEAFPILPRLIRDELPPYR